MKTMNKTLLATAVALASTQTFAAGFQLNSQSATGVGRAFAGDAVIADNASVLARNPAAMAMFDSATFSGGLTYADVSIEMKDVNFANGQANLGSIDDAGSGKIIPNFYFINPINSKVAIGWGLFSNFGTGTDGSSLKNSPTIAAVGGAPYDLLGNTEVTTINFNTSMSYRVNDQFSIGAGLDVVYGEGLLTRSAPGVDILDVEADGFGFGAIVGATYELNANNRFGLSYRFSPDVSVEGDLNTVTNPELPGIGATPVASSFDELKVPLADIFQFAGFHQLNNQFAVHYTAQYTMWSNFGEITLMDGNNIALDPNVSAALGTSQLPGTESTALKEYQWKDSWFLSLGGTYALNDQITLRAGYAYDFGVVDEISSVSIPDSDRQWFTAGIGYDLTPKNTIDFGIAYVRGEEVEFTEVSELTGPVTATTESGAIYYSLQYSHKF